MKNRYLSGFWLKGQCFWCNLKAGVNYFQEYMEKSIKIPFVQNPGNACALACYTMTAKYFFPETTFEEIAEISDWQPGYIVWAFKFWLWIMDKGIKIEDFDPLNLRLWADEGLDGLRKSASKEEFDFYLKNTKDIDVLAEDIQKVLQHKNFIHHQGKPSFEDLVNAQAENAVCEVVLNSNLLNGKNGLGLHRVVMLDIDGTTITFHDPSKTNPRPARQESIELFKQAWLSLSEPELCVYRRK